jgi:opacity protein-like surface antigen
MMCWRTAAALAAVASFASAYAAAQSAPEARGFSLRGGYSHIDFDDWGADDPDGHALQVYATYSFNRWLSAESGWFDASRVTGEVIEAPITILPDVRTLEARALTLGPRVRWQFDSGLSLYATGGYSRTNHFYRRVGGTFAIPDFTTGETRHDDEWFYGAGIGYALNDRAGVQLDYRRLEFSDLPLHSVGVLFSYRFGG